MNKFWMVWNQARNAPTTKHDSKTQACKEARKLAAASPGQPFIVLESCGQYEVEQNIGWIEHVNGNMPNGRSYSSGAVGEKYIKGEK